MQDLVRKYAVGGPAQANMSAAQERALYQTPSPAGMQMAQGMAPGAPAFTPPPRPASLPPQGQHMQPGQQGQPAPMPFGPGQQGRPTPLPHPAQPQQPPQPASPLEAVQSIGAAEKVMQSLEFDPISNASERRRATTEDQVDMLNTLREKYAEPTKPDRADMWARISQAFSGPSETKGISGRLSKTATSLAEWKQKQAAAEEARLMKLMGIDTKIGEAQMGLATRDEDVDFRERQLAAQSQPKAKDGKFLGAAGNYTVGDKTVHAMPVFTDQASRDAHQKAVDSGEATIDDAPRFGAVDVIKIGEGKTAGGAGDDLPLSPDQINILVRDYVNTGKVPSFGMGASKLREQFWQSYADYVNTKFGGNVAEPVVIRNSIAGLSKALTQQETKLGTSLSFVDNMHKQVGKFNALADELDVPSFDTRMFNVPLNFLMTKVLGDAQRSRLDTILGEITTEVGKLSSDGTASVAQLSEGARKMWEGVIDKDLSMTDLKSVLQEVVELGNIRLNSYNTAIATTQDTLRRVGSGDFTRDDFGPQKALPGMDASDAFDPRRSGSRATTRQAPEIPVGTVEGGFRFKGGDPGDENSWEEVDGFRKGGLVGLSKKYSIGR